MKRIQLFSRLSITNTQFWVHVFVSHFNKSRDAIINDHHFSMLITICVSNRKANKKYDQTNQIEAKKDKDGNKN